MSLRARFTLVIMQDAFLSLVSNTKAHILKLQSLECHFLNATYKPDDLAALGKIHRELSSRLEQMRVELADVSEAVERGQWKGASGSTFPARSALWKL